MKLIVGLGNPGSKYTYTRHNIGFIVIDHFAESNGVLFMPGKGDWYECSLTVNDEEVFLLKPVTFMNNSGSAVKEFCNIHNIKPEDVLAIYDDFQLPIGTVRVRKKGSNGGHNGISDIIYQMNTEEIPRMRIGIGNNNVLQKDDFIDFVLSDFTKDEMNDFIKIMPDLVSCIKSFITDEIKVTMNNFNKSFLQSTEIPKGNSENNADKKPDN
ncbi:MAG TPA: aminoacyl-tRNA hydrolase [Ignavibacteria bacterium]|nr:aminoacyl-tRNA hydrolase [Ignavibacteria bacterium]HQY52999.1 aminoacyl-tRNA hydrolase [Ignavibacteria bacterium]